MNSSLSRAVALALSAVVLAGCYIDQPTQAARRLEAPTATPSTVLSGTTGFTASADGLLTATQMKGLKRSSALLAPITVTKIIGSAGGTLTIPQAGATVTIPLGALTAPTTITMTARAGVLLAYDFAPHGITFAKPLTFTQNLAGTNASLLNAPLTQLGYYADPSALTTTIATVTELRTGTVNSLAWTFSSTITHFSGYVVTCGRSGY
ncbi:MAG: hypothetical protein ABIP93_10635 [Gemmatimonadaceae bacterium]